MKKFKLGTKVNLMLLLIAIVIGVITASFSFKTYSDFIYDNYLANATHVTDTVAKVIDTEALVEWEDKILEVYNAIPDAERIDSDNTGSEGYEEYLANFSGIETNDEAYDALYASLREVYEVNDVQSMYIFYLDAANKKLLYLIDVSDDAVVPGVIDPLYEINFGLLTDPSVGFPAYQTNTKEYGYLVSSGAPIYDKQNNIIGYAMVDISMNEVMSKRLAFLVVLVGVVALVSLVLSLVLIYVFKRGVVSPINSIAEAASLYIESEDRVNDNIFGKLSVKTGDELENLSNAMKKMAKDIEEYIVNLTKITAEKERIGAELSLATEIQASYLPNIFPAFPDRKEFDLYATMDPAKEVGGDFYDFFLIDDNQLGLVMADVSGKGVPAALFMMISKTLIKNQAMFDKEPGRILELVNKQLCDSNEADMFVTVWLGIIDISTGVMRTANAGHEYPAICRVDGKFELFHDKHGMPLGTIPGLKYREEEIIFNSGDTLFVYTDGVAEATDASNELYGTDRMIDALNSKEFANCDEIIKTVRADVDGFVKEAPQFDDITMLAFKYN